MISIYFDFNLFNQLHVALDDTNTKPASNKQNKDYESLAALWQYRNDPEINFITCEDDSVMEFANFNKKIRNLNEIEKFLLNNPRMLKRYRLFKEVSKGDLLICPYGEYGWGRGPFGGGPKEHYDLLETIRIMLNRTSPKNAQKDRDARHIMHSILYKCNHFITMDYKIIRNYKQRFHLIQDYLDNNGYILNITTPTNLFEKLNLQQKNKH